MRKEMKRTVWGLVLAVILGAPVRDSRDGGNPERL